MKFKSGLLVASAVLAMTAGIPAYAQDQIEIVTVTAAKREQNVQDVPISMNVLGANQLNKFNAASLSNLMASIPSLMLQKSQTNVGLFMRGFGTTPANPASDMAVSVYQDGIWQEKSRNLMIDFFDVQRIEVLRGAQGALVGKNTEVGAISIITNDPTDTFEGSATVNYNFDFKGVDTYGYVSGPITDTLSARLAVKFVDQSGYIKNLAYNTNEPDLSKYQGRLSLKFQPEEGITNVLKIEYSAWDQIGNTQLAGNPVLPLSTSLKVACCTKTDAGPLGRHTYDRQHGWRMSNKLDIDLGDGYTLTSLSGFTAYNSDSLGAGAASDPSGFATDFIEKYEGASTELRVVSPSGEGNPFDWIAGAYVDYSRYRFLNLVDYASNVAFLAGAAPPAAPSPGFGAQAPTAGGLTLDDTANTFSYSVYASGTWHVTDALRLVGNLRYTRSSKSAVYKQFQRYGTRTASTGGVLGQPLFAGLISTRVGNNGASFFDPSITLQYDLTDDIMVYGSWAKGSKGAAFDFPNRIINVSQFVFKPETSTSWEVGMKSNWFDNMVTFNLAAFWMKLKNMQVAGFDTTFNTLITKNAGVAESKGVEMSLNIRPLEGLSIDNNVNYLDTRYTDFPGAACLGVASPYYSGPTCTAATNNLKGVPLQFVPQWSGNTSIDYVTPVLDGLKLDVTGSVEWRGPIWLAPSYVLPYGKHNGMSKFNLRVAVGAEDDAWTVAVVGKNLTNTLTTNSSQTFWGGLETGKASEIEIFLDEPRNISLQGTIRF